MKDVIQKDIARVESYPADEMDGATADALRRRIVEVDTPLDAQAIAGRVAALLGKKEVAVLELRIDPKQIIAVLRAPSPVEYKTALNTLWGCQVDENGDAVADADGKLVLLPTEQP